MGMKRYRFVGLSRDVWLPDDIIVEIKIIDHVRFRSYAPYAAQTKTTWHDTGNPATRADGEWTWANNGRQGAEVGGYNFIFDDRKIIQAAPLNEITWAAGTAYGNTISWHAEQAFGGGVDFQRSLYVGAALHGGLCAAMGWDVDTALVKHQYWYGKWCPGQILNKNMWPQVVNMVKEAKARALAAAGGQVQGITKGSTVMTTDTLNVRQGSNRTYKIVMTLPKGTKATIKDGPRYEDGFSWYDIEVKGKGTGWAASDWLEKVGDAPAAVPPASLVFDGSKDVTINGVVFHADKRTVTLNAATNERQYADTQFPSLKLHAAGSKVQVLGWVKGQNVSGIDKWWVTAKGRIWSGTTR